MPIRIVIRQSSSQPSPSPPLLRPRTSVRTLPLVSPLPAPIVPHKVRKLASFSTPNYGKVKPPPLNFPSAIDNSPSYVSVSSTESTPLNASTSSVPAKRSSSGVPDDLIPRTSPKRSKTNHLPEKENIFRSSSQSKGKASARDPPLATPLGPFRTPLPAPRFTAHPSRIPDNAVATSLRAAFESIACDADLHQVRCARCRQSDR